jgi:hypothetical protein
LPTGYSAPTPPPPVFAPTRSIEGPYVPPRPAPRAVPQRPVVRPAPQRVVPQPASRPAQHRPKKQHPAKLPAPVPQAPAARIPPLPALPAAREVAQPDAPRSSGADAAALARWMNAKTLRSQFILTEILQPPLALREEKS